MCTFQALHSNTEKGKQKILDQILRNMYSLNLIFYWYLHSSNLPFFFTVVRSEKYYQKNYGCIIIISI